MNPSKSLKINENQWKSMVLVLLKILRYPVVPDRVQKARKHKNIFSNFLRHFRNVRFRGEKVFPPVWSGLPATTCLADFMKSPKTLKINENQWKSIKINENQWKSMKIVRGLAESLDLINKFWDFENFEKYIIFFVENWVDSLKKINDLTRSWGFCPPCEDFCTDW